MVESENAAFPRAALAMSAALASAASTSAAAQDAGTVTVPGLPHDLSPWSMFLHADTVVKGVMLGLALASVATWTLLFAKGAALLFATAAARRDVALLAAAEDLDSLAVSGPSSGTTSGTTSGETPRPASGPAAALLAAARDEARRSAALPTAGVKERAALSLQRVEVRAARRMARGTGVLATVGSVAPFVGLFGTVWGIMDSFVGISQAHTSNLAVVAPGIAEALLATAVGLVAAIPAVVIFNGFARATAGYRALLGDASAEVMRLLSRDLDRREAACGREATGPAARAAE